MNQKVIAARRRANSPRLTRVSFPTPLSTALTPALQQSALSYSAEAEEASIHHSLDFSFRQTIAVSHVDRQIIDNLSRLKAASEAR
jgi:hypothetical protein